MAGIDQTGAVVPPGVAPDIDFAAVESAVWSPSFTELAAKTHDDRLPGADWMHCLQYELATFLTWLARRALAARTQSHKPSEQVPKTAIVLLPRYGFALHALRRAVPFMALGIDTLIGVAREWQAPAEAAIMPLIHALGLDTRGKICKGDPADLITLAMNESLPVYLTGRTQTWHTLRSAFGDSLQIMGATGRCAVVLADDGDIAARVATALRLRSLNESCTRVVHTVVTHRNSDGSQWAVLGRPDGTSERFDGPLRELFTRLHPSIIVSPDPDRVSVDANYTIAPCDEDGKALTIVGFGRDPIAGWPGDYCL